MTDLENFLNMLRHANIVPAIVNADGVHVVAFGVGADMHEEGSQEVRFIFDDSLAKQLTAVRVAPIP
jgi:hypothetical protein